MPEWLGGALVGALFGSVTGCWVLIVRRRREQRSGLDQLIAGIKAGPRNAPAHVGRYMRERLVAELRSACRSNGDAGALEITQPEVRELARRAADALEAIDRPPGVGALGVGS